MKKFYVLGLALISAFAFSAVAAGAASAETLEWLVKGKQILGAEAFTVETKGLLHLIHLAGGFLNPEAIIHCEGTFDGKVLPAGADTVEALLEALGHEVNSSNPLSCENLLNCSNPEVFPQNLPWNTQLVLMAGPPVVWLDLFSSSGAGNPAYEIKCGVVKILCEGETSAVVTNLATSVLGVFNAEELELESLEGKCGSSNNVALQEGEGVTTLDNGEELQVSEV